MWPSKRTAPITLVLSVALLAGTVGMSPRAWADDNKPVSKPLSEGRKTTTASSAAATAALQATPTPTPKPASGLAGPRDTTDSTRRAAPGERTVDYGGSANDGRPAHARPGTHTVVLNVEAGAAKSSVKAFSTWQGACIWMGFQDDGVYEQVGWGNTERSDGSPCAAYVFQRAVDFEEGKLEDVPTKTIDRVVLTFDESAGEVCSFLSDGWRACWSNGDGGAEHKPNGCTFVRIPATDWRNASTDGLISYIGGPHPTVTRLGNGAWDVTEAYKWQNVPGAAPLGARPGYGFLLAGDMPLDQLQGEDDTNCISKVTNVKLHVTYTVANGPTGGPTDVIR